MADMHEPLVNGTSASPRKNVGGGGGGAADKTLLDTVRGRARTLFRFLFIEIYTNAWRNNREEFWQRLQSDVVAGITVGVMAVPQAMSYATVAGLEPVYGLYNAFVGILPYPIFGTSPQLVTGPTAVMSIMVKQSIPSVIGGNVVSMELHMYLAFLLSFFAGTLQLILGFFDLGYLVNLVSEPVIGGFTSAAAFLIMATQLATLLGVPKCKGASGKACTVIESVQNIFKHGDSIHPGTPVCAMFAISLLLFFKFKLKFSKVKVLKFIGNFGPLVLITICIPLAISLDKNHNTCVLNSKLKQVNGKCPVFAWEMKPQEKYPYTWTKHEGHKMEAGCCYDRDPFDEASNGDYDYAKTVHVFDKSWKLRQIGPIKSGLPSFSSPFKACTDESVTDTHNITLTNIDVLKTAKSTCTTYKNVNVSETLESSTDKKKIKEPVTVATSTEECTTDAGVMKTITTEHEKVTPPLCIGSDDIKAMLQSSLIIAFIGYMESMTIGKTVARQCGDEGSINPSNEFVALGACNILCSFLGGYPVTGSFSRTAVNGAAGATSSAALITNATIIIVGLMALTSILAYMPKFTLAAIVIEAIVKLVEIHEMVYLYKTDTRDFAVLMVTFLVVLFWDIEHGLMFGIVLGWLMKMTRAQKTQCVLIALKTPKAVKRSNGEKSDSDDDEPARCIGPSALANQLNLKYGFSHQEFVQAKLVRQGESLVVILKILADLDFANGYKIRESAADALECYRPYALILDVSNVNNMDTTGVHVLESVTTSAADHHTILALGGVKEDGIGAVVKKCCTARLSKVAKNWDWDTVHEDADVHNDESSMAMFAWVEDAIQYCSTRTPNAGHTEIAMKGDEEEVVEIDNSMRTNTMFELVNAPRNWMRAITSSPISGPPKTSSAVNQGDAVNY